MLSEPHDRAAKKPMDDREVEVLLDESRSEANGLEVTEPAAVRLIEEAFGVKDLLEGALGVTEHVRQRSILAHGLTLYEVRMDVFGQPREYSLRFDRHRANLD